MHRQSAHAGTRGEHIACMLRAPSTDAAKGMTEMSAKFRDSGGEIYKEEFAGRASHLPNRGII